MKIAKENSLAVVTKTLIIVSSEHEVELDLKLVEDPFKSGMMMLNMKTTSLIVSAACSMGIIFGFESY